jgi:hypothetical protein
MTKIGNTFVNMNHVFMVSPTTAVKQPFDFKSDLNLTFLAWQKLSKHERRIFTHVN